MTRQILPKHKHACPCWQGTSCNGISSTLSSKLQALGNRTRPILHEARESLRKEIGMYQMQARLARGPSCGRLTCTDIQSHVRRNIYMFVYIYI